MTREDELLAELNAALLKQCKMIEHIKLEGALNASLRRERDEMAVALMGVLTQFCQQRDGYVYDNGLSVCKDALEMLARLYYAEKAGDGYKLIAPGEGE